eukprot:364689-Chlamydomonas_euryale.AAC.1
MKHVPSADVPPCNNCHNLQKPSRGVGCPASLGHMRMLSHFQQRPCLRLTRSDARRRPGQRRVRRDDVWWHREHPQCHEGIPRLHAGCQRDPPPGDDHGGVGARGVRQAGATAGGTRGGTGSGNGEAPRAPGTTAQTPVRARTCLLTPLDAPHAAHTLQACEYFRIKAVVVKVDKDFRMTAAAVRARVNANTAIIVASAPGMCVALSVHTFPQSHTFLQSHAPCGASPSAPPPTHTPCSSPPPKPQ